MGKLDFYLFGQPRIDQGGKLVPFKRRKDLALLIYLAVTRKAHPRERLAALFWPEHEPERAFANLRRSVWELNQALGPGWLEPDRESVGLSPGEQIWLDVESFRSGLGKSVYQQESEWLNSLDQAIALYTDDFLAGFSLSGCPEFEEWQYYEAAGLRRELGKALEKAAEGYGAGGEFEKAIAYTRRWLSLDTFHEPAQRLLMRLLAWSGDRSAAIQQYQDCLRLLDEELGVLPEVETQQLYERIKSGEERWLGGEARSASKPASPAAVTASIQAKEPSPTNLPSPPTPFVGRETEIESITQLLHNPDCRLLTVLGPGGIGKTRLAIQSARLAAEKFDDGTFFISLVGQRSAQSILPAVASALDLVSQTSTESVDRRVLDYLCDKHLLLVLDNFEHLLDGAGAVSDLLEQTQQAKVLVTSRQRLQLQGEWVFEVKGMEFPREQLQAGGTQLDAGEDGKDGKLEEYSAIQLFMQSARRNLVGFTPKEADYRAAARISRLVSGMPLALELAAAWVPVLNVSEIADEIEQSLDILESSRSDAPARQRSVRAAFDYSWNLLGEAERQVFSGCSVFRSGFTRQAAQEILGASLRDLMNLVNKSLLQRTAEGRFEVHELLRQYGAEKLAETPVLSQRARDRHSAFYCLALREWERGLKGEGQAQALEEMRAESGNLQAAWRWAASQHRIDRLEQAVEGLCLMYWRRIRYEEGEAICQTTIEALSEAPLEDKRLVLACLYAWLGVFNQAIGSLDSVESSLKKLQELLSGSDLASHPAAERALGLAWECFGLQAHFAGDGKEAHRRFEASLQYFRQAGEPYWEAQLLYELSTTVMYLEGDADRARQFQGECLAIRRRLGVKFELAVALNEFAIMAAFDQGEIEAGVRMFRESHDLMLGFSDLFSQAGAIDSLSQVAFLTGDFQKDLELRQTMIPIWEKLGDWRQKAWAYSNLGETYKYLGDYEQAENLIRKAVSLFRAPEGPDIQRDLMRGGLGQVLLARGQLDEAKNLFELGVSTARAGLGGHNVGRELALLSRTELALGEGDKAWAHAVEALQLFLQRRHHHWLLYCLAGLAVLLAERGQAERAVEVYALIEHYPFIAASRWHWQLYGERIQAAAAGLPPHKVEVLRARSHSADIWAAAEQLAAELSA